MRSVWWSGLGLVLMMGCGAAQVETPRDFEQASLNRAWYGTYHRPLPENLRKVSDRTDRVARAPRDSAPRQAAAPVVPPLAAPPETSPRAGSRASLAPTPSATPQRAIPNANAGGFSPANAAAYVRDVYAVNETSLGDSDVIADIYRYANEHGRVYHSRPVVGDLVFFNNTHDADGDGRPNDFFSHVGIVENVVENGTVTVLSYLDGEVQRFQMNLERPSEERVDGAEANTVLRERSRTDLASTAYLAGELFAGFAGVLGNRSEVVVLDNWSPSTRLDGLQAAR
jgi:hypothetical protein